MRIWRYRDQLVKNRIVVGVSNDKLREYLIDIKYLTLPKCILKAKQCVSHHSQIQQPEDGYRESVGAIPVWKSRNNKRRWPDSPGR